MRAAPAAAPALGLLVVAALDTLVVLTMALNVVVVGAALGAYGLADGGRDAAARRRSSSPPSPPPSRSTCAPASGPARPASTRRDRRRRARPLAVAAVLETYVVL